MMEKRMKAMKEATVSAATRELLKKYNLKAAKKFGQNFLADESVLQRIIDSAALSGADCVLEIGPGLGTLTQGLCARAGKVLAVEIDRRLIPVLKVVLFGYDNVQVVNDDILKLDLKAVLSEHFGNIPAKVVANLPYYITTPIIMKLLEGRLNLESITVMVQKEVGERLGAPPGGKDYGALTVAVQYYCVPHKITVVPSKAFIPQPGVDSMVVRLDVRDRPAVAVRDEEMFFKVVKAAFAQRRKTLLNALSSGHFGLSKDRIKGILAECGIQEGRRGETLSLEEFAALADRIGDAAGEIGDIK